VKLPAFTYHRPDTVDEALALLGELGDDAKVLAGGQSLLPVLALRMNAVPNLVDIARIPELGRIESGGAGVDEQDDGLGEGRGITIGAGVRHTQAEFSAVVAEHAPLVAGALPWVGHRAIRNRGTVCGSLAHADPSAELPAVALALDAQMVVVGADGDRIVSAKDFFQGVFTADLSETELLRGVHIPPRAPRTGWSLRELSRRHGDFAIVGVAGQVRLDAEGAFAAAALAYFGVAGQPVRVAEAEAALIGRMPGDELYAEVAGIVSATLEPAGDLHGSSAYRKHVAGVLTRQALAEAVQRAAGSAGTNGAVA
jgi:carbon-monoxide dehydrogenase medium subunit